MPSLSARFYTAGLVVALLLCRVAAHAQTYTVLHNFTGGGDGAAPFAELTLDRAGNLYGTTASGGGGSCPIEYGAAGCGVVFKLSNTGSGWIETPLYAFQGGDDGARPMAQLSFGLDGALYGTTSEGGGESCGKGCGTVFKLTPQATFGHSVLCPWNETVIYRFNLGNNGEDAAPTGALTFDSAGNIYGTTENGEVYELTRSGGTWTETVLYNFTSYQTGEEPQGGVVFGADGNLYGVAYLYGNAYGAVYQLVNTGSGWTENLLYSFQEWGDGGFPMGGLTLDQYGCFVGGTTVGPYLGTGSGTVYAVCPNGGNWQFENTYGFPGMYLQGGPADKLATDTSGALYGTWLGGVFELGNSGFVALHNFDSNQDGAFNGSGVIRDASGHLYGTASGGNSQICSNGCGEVYEITP
jgi:uncharacterized repeat protein (TIGR03803 family)